MSEHRCREAEAVVQMFNCEFCEIFKNTSGGCFWRRSNPHGPFRKESHNQIMVDRSSYQRCSVKKSVLRNFAKFTGKHLCQSLFFPVNFAKFLRTPFLQNNTGRLLNPGLNHFQWNTAFNIFPQSCLYSVKYPWWSFSVKLRRRCLRGSLIRIWWLLWKI